jgi:exodeoxyribonuclease V alpha subunit
LLRSAVVGRPGEFRPLILDAAGRLYLQRYWQYEKELADAIREKASAAGDICEDTLNKGIDRLFPPLASGKTDWQALAAIAAVRKKFAIISGGPGTGKTSTVVKIIALLIEQKPEQRLRIALAAPTGKAAARLHQSISLMKGGLACSEATREQMPVAVSTMHRLLGSIKASVRFRHNRENRLPFDVVIIDEASMVDLPLMAKLVTALEEGARLILLGDKDQLASVEAGSVLGDLCGGGRGEVFSAAFRQSVKKLCGAELQSNAAEAHPPVLADTLVVLKKNYRFQDGSSIGRLATAINAGDGEQALALFTTGKADLRWGDIPPAAMLKKALAGEVVAGYRHYLAAETPAEALARFDAFRVLCALREGAYGVVAVNRLIEEILAENRLIDVQSRWYKGRPLIMTTNDYNMKLYNGDVGIVFPDPGGSGVLRVCFPAPDGGVRAVSPLRLPDHETVYAMTVHKSQGSEFERLLLLLPDHDSELLSRELLYTGITRAKHDVAVWGKREIFAAAVARRIQRTSGLSDALWGSNS